MALPSQHPTGYAPDSNYAFYLLTYIQPSSWRVKKYQAVHLPNR
jgi:hypothetical protein